MPYVIGIVLSLGVALFCEVCGIRSRSSVLSDGADCDCFVLSVICSDERIGSDGAPGVNRDDGFPSCGRSRIQEE